MDEKVKAALDFTKDCVEKYDNLAALSSFGKDSICMLDIVLEIIPDIPVIWNKPPFLPEETIDLAYELAHSWDLDLRVAESEYIKDPQWMEDIVLKPKLWETNPELCCQIFKVEPMMKMVHEMNLDAWFSGLRATESEKRSKYTAVWKQGPFAKLHPILDFTEADVWRYIAVHHLPVHSWYGEGYRSLGCYHCSAANIWTAERGGRWLKTLMEGGGCGIHETPMKK